jgi:hypothetical protein
MYSPSPAPEQRFSDRVENYVRYRPSYPQEAQICHEKVNTAALHSFFGGAYDTFTFANEQHFDFEGLQGRLLSSSYAAAAGQPGHEAMIAELNRIFDTHQVSGQVCFEYDTRVHVGH